MFIGLCLALIHLVVGVLNIFVERNHSLGALFVIMAIVYAFASFTTIFHFVKLGMILFIGLFFADFFIMLKFELILEFFSCLLAVVCIFLNILQIRKDYFAMESPDGEGWSTETKPILTGPTPDPLGFDKDYYYNKYYNIKKKKKKAGKKKKVIPTETRGRKSPRGAKDKKDDIKEEIND